MKKMNQQKGRYSTSGTSDAANDSFQGHLVAALAPLYSVARAEIRMDVALTTTADTVAQAVVSLYAGATQQTSSVGTTRNLMDDAEEDLESALNELDQSDPFEPIFGEGADFPQVCFDNWREQVSNILEARQNIERRLIEEGDPDAHQHANDAIRNSSRAASEALARCLHSPIRKLPVE